ncbi:MAG TPA: NAD-dependent epimerase/dehydratase family protein [Euryarchaeota archaeon]|nr:NAD-dependent epimerase/dehydratase family protein [Euryarchaeota archaeon]
MKEPQIPELGFPHLFGNGGRMMKALVLGASGQIGALTVQDLVEMCKVDVIASSRSLERTKKAVKDLKINPNKVTTMELDANDLTKLDKVMKKEKPDTVVNCAWYQTNLGVMSVAVKNGVHYTDLGGFFDTTLKQIAQSKKWKDAGVNATVGLGSTPGMTNVAGAAGAARLDKVDTIDIYCSWGNTLPIKEAGWPGYSIRTVIDEFTQQPVAWLNGKHKKMPILSGEKEVLMQEPIGKVKSYYIKHSEPATMGKNLKAKNVTFRIGFPAQDLNTFKTLVQLGFASTKPLKANDGKVSPIDYLTIMYQNAISEGRGEKPPKEKFEFDDFRIDVFGQKNGLPAVATYFIETWNDPVRGISSARDTAVPPAIVSYWQGTKKIKAPGAYTAEVTVDPIPFFKELGRRKINVTEHFERVTKYY